MPVASQLRAGTALRLSGDVWKVLAAEYHGGGGKMGGVTHARLRNVKSGTQREWRFRADETIETVELEKRPMQFLFGDVDTVTFMNPETFEQTEIETALLGKAASFLTPEMTVPVEFCEGRPIGVTFPEIVEVRVARTAAPVHTQGQDNVRKEATLENGLALLVPPFIAEGEWIRVDVEKGTYVERAKGPKRKA
jgi:elongation factor P